MELINSAVESDVQKWFADKIGKSVCEIGAFN